MSESEQPDAPLAVRGLSAGYGRGDVLEALDIDIPAGQFTALIGPNGCGKSTLLRALCGLLPARSGEVHLDGRDLSRIPSKRIARRVGMLPQGPVAPEGLSVEELVRQGRYPHRSLLGQWSRRDEEACRRAMELTGLTALAERPLEALSGGQRQRAWIAMTLAQETGILLLDEPTTYLDLAHQIEVLDLVVTLVREQGTTAVAVLHDIGQAARYADHMVAMKGGRIVAKGSPEAVITEATVSDVFGVTARVIPCPVLGVPTVVPLGRA